MQISTGLWDNLRLSWVLGRNDLKKRYARTVLGPVWFILRPALLLAIFWMVFGVILDLSWRHPVSGQSLGFVVPFFTGYLVFLVVTDLIGSSIKLFQSKKRMVKSSPVSLWVIFLSNFLRAWFHGLAYLLVLGALSSYELGISGLHPWMPLILLLVLVATAALSLILAVLGPFFADLSEATQVLQRVLFYTSAIAFPLAMVPEPYRSWLWLNPLTAMIELLRYVVVYGISPPMNLLSYFALGTSIALLIAIWFYRRVSNAISDVV